MNKAILSLNFMYAMERFATANYRIQQNGFQEDVINRRMIQAVENENQHAMMLKTHITGLRKTPLPIAFLFQIAGTLLGLLSKCFGRINTLKIDVAIERRAVRDYGYFLSKIELDNQAKVLIKSIIADEELHIVKWLDSIKILQKSL
jgi:bacterioferritin